MLQQTTVAAVIPRYERWLWRFPDFQTLARTSETVVLREWEGLGYYARARNLHALAKLVVSRHGGRLPSSEEELRVLPGMGPYTVGALLSFAFDKPFPALDANISRVLARLHDIREPIDTRSGRCALEAAAFAMLPSRRGGAAANGALMELGALICRAGQPECSLCPVRAWCRTDSPADLPRKAPRKPVVQIHDDRLWLRDSRGRIALRRSEGPRWKGLYLLPECLPSAEASLVYEAAYTVTHHRVILRIHRERKASAEPASGTRPHAFNGSSPIEWVDAAQLARLPLPAPFRKAVLKLADKHSA